jgi:hypothetical protein
MTRRRRISLGVVAATLALAAVAFGFISVAGSGAGTPGSSTATPLNITISPATATAELYPGGSADISLTISNPNVSPSHLNSLVLDTSQGTNNSGFKVDDTHAANGCTVSSLSFTPQSNGGAGWDVPVKVGTTNGSLPLDLANAVSMGTSAENACQGAQFTVYVKAGS